MTHRHLDVSKLRQQLLEVNREAEALCQGLDANQLGRRPAPNRWSIAENLIHLKLIIGFFEPAVAQAIESATPATSPFSLGAYGRFLVWVMEPPCRMRAPAPEPIQPPSGDPPASALPGFLEAQEKLLARLNGLEGLNLTGPRFPSPVSAAVRMNLLEYYAIHIAHARRHLWQATNVRHNIASA